MKSGQKEVIEICRADFIRMYLQGDEDDKNMFFSDVIEAFKKGKSYSLRDVYDNAGVIYSDVVRNPEAVPEEWKEEDDSESFKYEPSSTDDIIFV